MAGGHQRRNAQRRGLRRGHRARPELPALSLSLPPRGAALLLALTAALLVLRLGEVPLVGPDEPRYARVAIEMHRAGQLVTPTLQGEPWLEKPALFYWLAGAAFSVLGETETAARLPSVFACLLLVGATALLGARLFGAAAGLHAGFVLGLSPLTFAYGRAATMDMLLASNVTVAVGLLALRFLGVAGPLAIPAAYVFIGLATLAKGPLGFLLPGLVVIGYVLATREWRLLREVLSPLGIALFLIVAGPWYAAILFDQGRTFVDLFLLNHNIARFTSTVHHHPGPVYYYVAVVLAGLFPWSGLAIPALWGVQPRRSRAELFLLLWLALPFLFFTTAGSKLPGYILPCLPPLALLMGRAAAEITAGETRGTRLAAVLGLALAALLFAAPFLLRRQGEPAWSIAAPLGAWALLVAFVFSWRIAIDASGALRVLRIGAAGLLLLATSAAPPLVAHRESGRTLFLPARGREVLAWGAWRTAWMAGYFYNDGKVREVGGLKDVLEAAAAGPALVLCGPGERRQLGAIGSLKTLVLAEGPRDNALIRVEKR